MWCREQLKEVRAELAGKVEQLGEMTNAKESLAVQLAATETTLEEQARSSQALEEELAQCQEELQRASAARETLQVRTVAATVEIIPLAHICWFWRVLLLGIQVWYIVYSGIVTESSKHGCMHACMQGEASKVEELLKDLESLRSKLAERDSALNEAAVALETLELEARAATERESAARDDGARTIAQVSALQVKLNEVEAAWQAALREKAAAAEDVSKLRGDNEQVR